MDGRGRGEEQGRGDGSLEGVSVVEENGKVELVKMEIFGKFGWGFVGEY